MDDNESLFIIIKTIYVAKLDKRGTRARYHSGGGLRLRSYRDDIGIVVRNFGRHHSGGRILGRNRSSFFLKKNTNCLMLCEKGPAPSGAFYRFLSLR